MESVSDQFPNAQDGPVPPNSMRGRLIWTVNLHQLTLGSGEDRERWSAGNDLQSTQGLQDAALQAAQHQHHHDADELGSQSVAMQSALSGFVKQKVAVEGHKGRHTDNGIHVQVWIDRIHLEKDPNRRSSPDRFTSVTSQKSEGVWVAAAGSGPGLRVPRLLIFTLIHTYHQLPLSLTGALLLWRRD